MICKFDRGDGGGYPIEKKKNKIKGGLIGKSRSCLLEMRQAHVYTKRDNEIKKNEKRRTAILDFCVYM